jgi:hypothetical protein
MEETLVSIFTIVNLRKFQDRNANASFGDLVA